MHSRQQVTDDVAPAAKNQDWPRPSQLPGIGMVGPINSKAVARSGNEEAPLHSAAPPRPAPDGGGKELPNTVAAPFRSDPEGISGNGG